MAARTLLDFAAASRRAARSALPIAGISRSITNLGITVSFVSDQTRCHVRHRSRRQFAFALPRCLNALEESHVLAAHLDLESTRNAAPSRIEPRSSSRHLWILADENITNGVAASAL